MGNLATRRKAKLIALFGNQCMKCKQELVVGHKRLKPTVDHIKPLAKQGSHGKFMNLQLLCGACNSAKGSKFNPANPNEYDFRTDEQRAICIEADQQIKQLRKHEERNKLAQNEHKTTETVIFQIRDFIANTITYPANNHVINLNPMPKLMLLCCECPNTFPHQATSDWMTEKAGNTTIFSPICDPCAHKPLNVILLKKNEAVLPV